MRRALPPIFASLLLLAPAACDDGGSGKSLLGTRCSEASQCASGHCSDGRCCESACDGTCLRCTRDGECVPVEGEPDPDTCPAPDLCDSAGACKASPPAPCTSGEECASGHCADGVCCDSACTEVCMACDVAGQRGRCAAVKSAEDADTCAGPSSCDGGGVCRLKQGEPCSDDTDCLGAACADGVCCSGTCEGPCLACHLVGLEGTCSPMEGLTDGAQCADPNVCSAEGLCLLEDGEGCANDDECASGFCDASGTCVAAPEGGA